MAATEYYCYPIGFVLGGLCGVTNEYIRQSLAEKTTDDFNNEC